MWAVGCPPGMFWSLTEQGVDFPLKLHGVGHFVLSVVALGRKRDKSEVGPAHSASFLQWAFPEKRPNLANGVLRWGNPRSRGGNPLG